MSKLSNEEVKYNSIMETQKSLVELGNIQQKEKTRVETMENKYRYLENDISTNMTYSILIIKINDILTKRIMNDRRDELMKLFKVYNDFFVLNKDILINMEKHTYKLEDDYNSLRSENNETNKEYDEKQRYWETRVIALRQKCMVRNKQIIDLKQSDLYNTYNIVIKNCGLIIMCLFNFDITEFIYNYFIYILIIVCYSFFNNLRIIIRYGTITDG